MKIALLLICCFLFLCSCQSNSGNGASYKAGTYKRKTDIKFKGQRRNYRLHVPNDLPEKNWPVVVVLHGAFNNAKGIEAQSGFSRLADEKGFCVAYPNGIGIFGLLQHWNAGYCCGKALKDDIDDVAYLQAVIDDLLSAYPIDPERIFMVGHSNGGMMVYRFAGQGASQLAAAAVVSGAINSKDSGWCIPKPVVPLPFFIIHGTDDRAIPYEGGPSSDKPEGNQFSSVMDAVDFWTDHNGTNAEVQLESLEGWGHDWPGNHFGSTNFEAAEAIWTFFEYTIP